MVLFQSTLPREERLYRMVSAVTIHDFNPRSHERSDKHEEVICKCPNISIHAPTRGATYQIKACSNTEADFNPRSHERSDINIILPLGTIDNFNPRSHERSDTDSPCTLRHCLISIHAPTRGATGSNCAYAPRLIYFNPRSHERSDCCSPYFAVFPSISIHAPTRGATSYSAIALAFMSISIHAPTRGATQTQIRLFRRLTISIHAPTRGATSTSTIFFKSGIFQSTLPREERLHCPNQ